MGKITGFEGTQELPAKVLLLYEAVEQLIAEGADIKDICVSTITDRAGIGKGTAYDYFESKDDILACAVSFYMRKTVEELKSALVKCATFPEQINCLLDEIEKDGSRKQYLIKYVHFITDTSEFSRMVQEKLGANSEKKCPPLYLYTDIVERAKENGEVRQDLPTEYMVYVLFSKILLYVISIGKDHPLKWNDQTIRPFVYQGILDELCNV